MQTEKKCSRCNIIYPLTNEYFYPARKLDRKKIGWQSYCKSCWKDINLANKTRRRDEGIRKAKEVIDGYFRTSLSF